MVKKYFHTSALTVCSLLSTICVLSLAEVGIWVQNNFERANVPDEKYEENIARSLNASSRPNPLKFWLDPNLQSLPKIWSRPYLNICHVELEQKSQMKLTFVIFCTSKTIKYAENPVVVDVHRLLPAHTFYK